MLTERQACFLHLLLLDLKDFRLHIGIDAFFLESRATFDPNARARRSKDEAKTEQRRSKDGARAKGSDEPDAQEGPVPFAGSLREYLSEL